MWTEWINDTRSRPTFRGRDVHGAYFCYLEKKRDIMIANGWAGEEEDRSSRLPQRLSQVDREGRRGAVCVGANLGPAREHRPMNGGCTKANTHKTFLCTREQLRSRPIEGAHRNRVFGREPSLPITSLLLSSTPSHSHPCVTTPSLQDNYFYITHICA